MLEQRYINVTIMTTSTLYKVQYYIFYKRNIIIDRVILGLFHCTHQIYTEYFVSGPVLFITSQRHLCYHCLSLVTFSRYVLCLWVD